MNLTRKQFLTRTLLAGATAAAWPGLALGKPVGAAIKNKKKPADKLNVAIIGAGGMGSMAVGRAGHQNLIAFCDVDTERAADAYTKHPGVPTYQDFRKMLDRHHAEIDAVLISTPDHTHFPATMAAMELGKHVFVQKPLTHDIWQARTLQRSAHRYGVKAIMGNQGRCGEGIRQIKEWHDAGLLGDVTEVHAWTVRPYPGWRFPENEMPAPRQPVPANLDWDLWQGPVPERNYNACYVPKLWRAWWDYGNSAMGDIGCHLLDSAYWALDLTGPVTVQAQADHFHDQMTPADGIVRFDYPQRGDKPPVAVHWYEGGLKPDPPAGFDFGSKLPDEGILIRGSKHTVYHAGIRPDQPLILMSRRDWRDFRESELPEPTIPRLPKNAGPIEELFSAIRDDTPIGSDFDYAAPLTELCCLGALARRTGKVLDYDPAAMRFADASLNRYIKAPVRAGWAYGDGLWT